MNKRIAFLPILAYAAIGFAQTPIYKPHAYQQNDWFAEYGENAASYVNPASISEADQIEVSAAAFRTLSWQAGQEFVSVVHPFGYNHTLGISYFENGSQIDGSNVAYFENVALISYALRLPASFPSGISNKLSLGATSTLFQYNPFEVFEGTEYAFGLDLGLSYNPFNTSAYGQLLLGLAFQNALAPKIKTNENGSYKIPSNINASLFWRGFDKRLELAGSASILDVLHESAEGGTGNQMVPSGRATYYMAPWAGVKLKYSKEGYPVFGLTANVQRLNLFRYLQFDLDMSHDALPLAQNEERGFIWNLRTIARFGPTREERLGDARYRRLLIEPEEAYREAMRLYLARKFLPAAYAFGKVTSKYPNFHLVDQASFYKGKSFENLRMNQAAREVYEDAMTRYTDSELRPKFMFQLMNLSYKEGKYEDATRTHQQLVNLYPESDVKPDADYVMGQIKYLKKDYTSAISFLTPIPSGNSNYPYARYTMGVSNANLSRMSDAEAAFTEIAKIIPSNSSEQEMKDLAALKLGHINFGKPQLKNAAEFYASVSTSSPKYDEALLGLAWAFLKERHFKGTANYAGIIISKLPNSVLVPEAHLLLGYSAYFEKNFDLAVSEFEKAIDLAEKKATSIQELKRKYEENVATGGEFISVQQEALELASQLPSERIIQKQGQLQSKFETVQSKVENYIEFKRELEQFEKFLRAKDQIVKDAKFTKATVGNIKAGSGQKPAPSQQDLQGLEVQ